jgi:superfamily II DNA or RNA helicase
MKIEKYLVLNKYISSLFGVEEFKVLQERLKGVREGYDAEGRSYFLNSLRATEGINEGRLPEDTLFLYDYNIQIYLVTINRRREPKITLRYFQYLSILFAEIFLDNLKNRKIEFLYELNEFLRAYGQKDDIGIIEDFTEYDLKKLAFWMATGSGKTLIMHINYLQFFHYMPFVPENILLITPNEGLSKQHFEELEKSSIPCRLYEGSLSGFNGAMGGRGVLVIEITKLVEEKKGGGVTLPVDTFEGKNLLFVDEGHKGKKSEEQKWKKLRDKLAQDGFTFEYSATFGQILSEKNPEIFKEYAKSIVFDYSYKYFYLDGYGKDFSVLNVQKMKISEREFQEAMFVANLLSFYEQTLIYENHQTLSRAFNIEKPLWIFVGTTVTGKEEESDVIQIVDFLRKAIQNQKWVKDITEKIIKAESGLKNDKGEDVFNKRFEYLKKNGFDNDDLYRKIFGGKGEFGVYEIKNAMGELGLKTGENDYFGVVNIGDVTEFRKKLEKKGITANRDVMGNSLFDSIKREDSSINLLIGSKKFIEGWDTWRVSSMGLLNIGTGQGPQIIQLFGRGVRLKGKGFSLKRSDENSPVKFLEFLNIYGIKADYLNRFLDAIRKEEVEFEVIEIPVKPQHKEKWANLYALSKDENKKFVEEKVLPLDVDKQVYFRLNLSPRIKVYRGIIAEEVSGDLEEMRLPEEIVRLLNWQEILKEISDYKMSRGYWNLIFDRKALENILLSDRYMIYAPLEVFFVKNKEDLERIRSVTLMVIKKYMDHFYRKYAKNFETKYMRYEMLKKQQPLFVFEKEEGYSYTVQIKKTPQNKALIEDIRKLARDFEALSKEEFKTLPRVYFANHLYLPILLQSKAIERISPSGLVESEKEFIQELKNYLRDNKDKFTNVEIYLLRNFPMSGVGFFNLSGFYPDFIMWLKNGGKQKIVFIDPKGLEHTKGLDDEKIQLSVDIKGLERELGGKDVVLESFILSQTSYDKLRKGRTAPEPKEEYIKKHVLFLDEKEWPDKFFELL